jgi:hypothetical protein
VLYGKRIRQPIGGDFGFSGQLAEFYLTKDVWDTDVARYGIDIWMTTTAITNKFRVCQSFLGAKIHDPKDPGADLSAMLFQVVGSAFNLMETYSSLWKGIQGSEEVPTFGFRFDVGLEPVTVNLERMIENFRLGIRELEYIWKIFTPPDVLDFLKKVASADKNSFHISDEIWVKIIYSFAAAAHSGTLNKEHLLKSLTPLYLARIASFVVETWESNAAEVEKKIEQLCVSFEKNKPYLLDNWK